MPPRLDIAVALLLAVLGVLEPTVLGSVEADPLVAAPLTAAAMSTLAFRRVAPGPAAAALLAVLALQEYVAAEPASGMAAFLGMLLAVGTLAARAPAPDAAAWGVATLALLSLTVAADRGADGGDFAYAWTMWLAAAVTGRTLRVRQQRAESAERAAGEAVDAERARLARELHDVVAHGLSVIHIQARVAGELMERDRGAARSALGSIEETAHHALADMRRMLALLRAENGGDRSPQPGLDDIPALLERTRQAGLPVDYEEAGRRLKLSPGVDLAIYRLVQEALTNVLKHAGPVQTRVRLAFAAQAVEVEVVNAAANGARAVDGGGHGLAGMRERAGLFGGDLQAEPLPGGGFRVLVRLPAEAP